MYTGSDKTFGTCERCGWVNIICSDCGWCRDCNHKDPEMLCEKCNPNGKELRSC